MAKKLKRDLVVSSTDRGDRVGVYFVGESGRNILFELSPDDADLLIRVWNRLVDKYK